MTTTEARNLATVRQYLASLEAGEAGEAMARFFAEDVLQVELPNKLNPRGMESDLSTLLKRVDVGRKLIQDQDFEIRSEMAQGERVAVEARWSGVLTTGLGALEPGTILKAHFAMFFEFRSGKIVRQRNYDCFEP